MSEHSAESDVLALADQLDRWERGLDGANETDHWADRLARALLASDRLAQIKADAWDEALGSCNDYSGAAPNPYRVLPPAGTDA